MKYLFNAKNRKKGFTLVELCIVIAIIAIVGTMVTTTIVFFSSQNNDVQKEASFIADVTNIQGKVHDWIMKYDNTGYAITHNGSQSSLTASRGSESSAITFQNGKLKVDGASISEKYKNVSKVTFQIIEDKSASGNIEGKLAQVKITAKKGSGTEVQTLLFPLFSNKTRERSVTGKNG